MKQEKDHNDEELYQQFMKELQEGADEYDRIISCRRNRRSYKLWSMIAAACVAGIIIACLYFTDSAVYTSPIAKVEKKSDNSHSKSGVNSPIIVSTKAEMVKQLPKTSHKKATKKCVAQIAEEKEDEPEEMERKLEIVLPQDEAKAYYTGNNNMKEDTYQSPADADAYICRLADYYQVNKEILNDESMADSSIVDCIYVFTDTKEIDLFNKLLQMAFWYDKDIPGYFLNFSCRQYLFKLKDVRTGMNYLWLAEKAGNSILVYLAHSPSETKLISRGYWNFRDTWVKKNNKSIMQL